MFRQESYTRIDKYTRAARAYNILNQWANISVPTLQILTTRLLRWMGLRVDTLAALFTAGVGAYLVYGPPRDPSSIGFSLNMAGKTSVLVTCIELIVLH